LIEEESPPAGDRTAAHDFGWRTGGNRSV
jgi:hypothetical protein